jgi:hypothetical protein
MNHFFKIFFGGTFMLLIAFPIFVNKYGLGLGSERDAAIIARAQHCAPGQRDSQGRCLTSVRGVGARRSIFSGSRGRGK